MCKGMIMPNGEILPATARALLGHGRGRVLIFSTGFATFPAYAHAGGEKSFGPRSWDATRRGRALFQSLAYK